MTRDADKIATVARPITGPADYEPLRQNIGNRHLVLIGEASHGTHQFYQVRAELTKWLIEHKGFTSVAVEADWPDALRVHRTYREPATSRTRTKRCVISNGFHNGCGVTRLSSSS